MLKMMNITILQRLHISFKERVIFLFVFNFRLGFKTLTMQKELGS